MGFQSLFHLNKPIRSAELVFYSFAAEAADPPPTEPFSHAGYVSRGAFLCQSAALTSRTYDLAVLGRIRTRDVGHIEAGSRL